MPAGPLSAAVAQLGHAVRPPDPRPDTALVGAFVRDRDEAAAAELVRRHGPMVYGVCRRIHLAEADDAFQAVWLVFSRKAGQVRPPGAVGAWLHGVAVKVATKARTQSFTRRRRLMATARPEPVFDPPADPLLAAVLDEELARLPDKYRRAVLLCDLGGKTRVEAAAELGWPEGTVATRLTRGRERLAARLRRRGVTLPAAGLTAALAPQATAVPVPAALGLTAVQVVLGTATVPPAALPLADAAGSPMIPTSAKLAALGLLAAVTLTAGGIGFGPPATPDTATADQPAGGWELVATLTDHSGRVDGVAFAPDGKTVTTLGGDGRAIVWDAATLAKKHTLDVWAGGERPAADKAVPWQTIRPITSGTNLAVSAQRTGGGLYAAIDPAAGRRTAYTSELAGALVLPRVPNEKRGAPAPVTLQRPGDAGGHLLLDLPWLVTVGPFGARAAVCERLDPPQDGRTGLMAFCDTATGKTLDTLPFEDVPLAADWSPDKRNLLLAGGRGELAEVQAWGDQYAKLWKDVDPTVTTVSLRYAPDGGAFVTGRVTRTAGGPVVAGVVYRKRAGWPPAEPAELLPVHPTVPVCDWAFSPDGNTLVAAVGDRGGPNVGEVRVYRRRAADPPPPAGEWRLKATLKDHGQMVYDAAFSPDGKTFATAGADGQVFIWDTATLAVRHRKELVKNLSPPAPDIRQPFDPKALAMPAPAGNPRKPGSNPPAVGVRFNAADELVARYTALDGKPNQAWITPSDGKTQMVVVGAVEPMAVGGGKGVFRADGEYVVHPLPAGPEVRLDVPKPDPSGKGFFFVIGSAVSADGTVVALSEWYGEAGSKLRVCDAATGKTLVVRSLGANTSMFNHLAFAPDGRRLSCGSNDGRLVAVNTADWAEAYRVEEPLTRWTDALAFTPDGKQLLVAGYREEYKRGWFNLVRTTIIHRELWVRDAATGTLLQTLSTRTPARGTTIVGGFLDQFGLDVSALRVSPDGRTLVVTLGSPNRGEPVQPAAEQAAKAAAGEVRVYVRGDAKPPAPPKADPPKAADEVERNQDLWVWQPRAVPEEEGGKMPRSVAFTPDGKFLVTGGTGRAVQFWTLATNPLRSNELSLHPSPVDDKPTTAAVAPNGKTVAFTRPNGVTVSTADPGCWHLGPPRGKPVPPDWEERNPRPQPAQPADKVFELMASEGHPPTALAFSPDGTRLAFTDGRRLTVREIGRPGEVGLGPLADSTPGPAAVSWAADGRRLVVLPNNTNEGQFVALVWGAGSGEPMQILAHGEKRLTAAVWAGDRILTADAAGEVVVWDAATFKERKRLKVLGPVTALAVRPDAKRFAVGVTPGDGPRVQVWTVQDGSDPDNWQRSSSLPAPATVGGLAFAPDGKTLAAGTDAGLAVWGRVKLAPKE